VFSHVAVCATSTSYFNRTDAERPLTTDYIQRFETYSMQKLPEKMLAND